MSSSVITHIISHHWPNFIFAQLLDPNVHNAQLFQCTFLQPSLAKFQPCPVLRCNIYVCTALQIHISTAITDQISNLPLDTNVHNAKLSQYTFRQPSLAKFQPCPVLSDATFMCALLCKYTFQRPSPAKFQPCPVVR